MAIEVKHQKVSAKADGPDATLILPSDWNDTHTITLAGGKVLGRAVGSSGDAQELPLAFDSTLQSMLVPFGTTAERPAGTNGMIRYNTTLNKMEMYVNGVWEPFPGGGGSSSYATADVVVSWRNTAPAGTLKANGAAVSRATYSALFSAIGTTYGVGDGSTTFNLPDARGEFLRGWDDGRGIDTGRGFGSFQDAAMLNHTHSGTTDVQGAHSHVVLTSSGSNNGVTSAQSSLFTSNFAYNIPTNSAGAHAHNMTTGNPSAGGGTETRPRNLAPLICIAY